MLEAQTLEQTLNPPHKVSLKQPKALYLLFFTELWERFGFYTLQTIIILYMTKGLMLGDSKANLLYASFSALLYLTPTIGGYLADKHLGFQRTINLGGILFIIGYLICAMPQQTSFFLGLSLLVCANGFFKPNVSSIVGELYQENDPRREGGFTLFYMGINIGALIPPLIAGALVTYYGWHSGFILAAIGMAIGQIVFMLFKYQLGTAGLSPKGGMKPLNYRFYILLTIGICAALALCQLAFQYPEITNALVEFSALLVAVVVLYYLFQEAPQERKKMFAAFILIVISTAFWAIYNQTFTSLMLFADRNMERSFLGFPFDAEATQFFNPFFIIALSPLLSPLWIRLDKFDWNPSTQMKFFLGILFISTGYLLLVIAGKFAGHNGLVSAWWLGSSYLLQTVGELLISPIGLAMITVLCPKRVVGLMMGVWFFAQAASFALGGFLANIAAIPEKLSPVASLPIYTHAFLIYGVISLVMALISLAFVPLINRLVKA